MKYIQTIISICVAAVGLAGCDRHSPTSPSAQVIGSGVLVTETLPIGPISEVSVRGAGRLIIDQYGPETLETTAEDNILPLLKAEVVNGRLSIGPDLGSSFESTRGVVYRLGARALKMTEASGASRIESESIEVDRLTVLLSGASAARITGAVAFLELQASGASNAVLDGIRSPEVRVTVSGSSYARVRSSDHLTVSASGASLVEYSGDPVLIVSVSGNSSVRRIGP